MSVDRLSLDGLERPAEIADRYYQTAKRVFYGWAAVTATDVVGGGCVVVSSPTTDNLYHADIVLPDLEREEQKKHAQILRDRSFWRESPLLPAL